MKRVLVVILSVLVLMGVFPETCDYVFFKLNQVDIASTLCIQKDKKVNTCQGKCYLKKMMTEEKDHSKPYSPKEKENNNPNIYCLKIEGFHVPQPTIISRKQSNYSTIHLIDRLAVDRLLRPPDELIF